MKKKKVLVYGCMLCAFLLLSSILLLINMHFEEKAKANNVQYVAKMHATRTSVPVKNTS
ncbi:hypothetical protein [Bacillus methanolicus]|uniref:hypothetical protein n=1 Tax=Bacillus methanolicus TaxID=1471 RepID=UPI00200D32D1|nr:hypothetical protein [Bacillus methanolicus]